jgi:hypothetical protein
MGTEACEISQPVNRLDLTLSPREERVGREPERGAARGSIAVFCDAPPLPNPLLRCVEERESGTSSPTGYHRRLVSGAVLSEFRHHACENCEQFIGFAQQRIDDFTLNAAVVAQQFQPELRLVRLLEQSVEFGAKLGIGTGPRGFVQPVK